MPAVSMHSLPLQPSEMENTSISLGLCGSQALYPSLWATATLTASSDSMTVRPTEATGGAYNLHSAECRDAASQ